MKLSVYSTIRFTLACAYSEYLNQSAHAHSLISLSFPPKETLDVWLPNHRAPIDDSH